MTNSEFSSALARTRMSPDGRAARGAHLALVDGLLISQAATVVGLHRSAVSRAVARLRPVRNCPHCHGTGFVQKR